jgi:hypothetical protein
MAEQIIEAVRRDNKELELRISELKKLNADLDKEEIRRHKEEEERRIMNDALNSSDDDSESESPARSQSPICSQSDTYSDEQEIRVGGDWHVMPPDFSEEVMKKYMGSNYVQPPSQVRDILDRCTVSEMINTEKRERARAREAALLATPRKRAAISPKPAPTAKKPAAARRLVYAAAAAQEAVGIDRDAAEAVAEVASRITEREDGTLVIEGVAESAKENAAEIESEEEFEPAFTSTPF